MKAQRLDSASSTIFPSVWATFGIRHARWATWDVMVMVRTCNAVFVVEVIFLPSRARQAVASFLPTLTSLTIGMPTARLGRSDVGRMGFMLSAASVATSRTLGFPAQKELHRPLQPRAPSGWNQRRRTIGSLAATWVCMDATQTTSMCIAAFAALATSQMSIVQGHTCASSRHYRRCHTSGIQSATMGCWVAGQMGFIQSAGSALSGPSRP